jgi:hypothetical protein
MAYTDDAEEGIGVLISQQKWDKANRMLSSLGMKLEESPWVDHKEFERIRGGDLCFADLPTADPVSKGPTSD